MGLSWEKAGLAWTGKSYLDSETAFNICQQLGEKIEQASGLEHDFYRAGERAFHSQAFMGNTIHLAALEAILGVNWKRLRYHHLVRLGGDILRSGLASYSKATILGALLFYAKNQILKAF